jgi:hypothetical protein
MISVAARANPRLSHAVSKMGTRLRRIVALDASPACPASKKLFAVSLVPSSDPSSTTIQSNGSEKAPATDFIWSWRMLEWSKTGVTTVNVGALPVSVARYSSSGVARRGCGEGLFTSREKHRPLYAGEKGIDGSLALHGQDRGLPNGQHPGQGGVDASSGVERGAHDHGELSSLRGQPQLQRRVLRTFARPADQVSFAFGRSSRRK